MNVETASDSKTDYALQFFCCFCTKCGILVNVRMLDYQKFWQFKKYFKNKFINGKSFSKNSFNSSGWCLLELQIQAQGVFLDIFFEHIQNPQLEMIEP